MGPLLVTDIGRVDQVDPQVVVAVQQDDVLGITEATYTEPRCHTCNSDYRRFIESRYLMGMKPNEILKAINEEQGVEPDVSERAMHNHFAQGHCLKLQATEKVDKWRRAMELGVDPQTYMADVSDSVRVTKMVVQKFEARLLSEFFNPDIKEGLAAAKALYEMEKLRQVHDGGYEARDIFIAVSIFMSHVNAMVNRFVPNQADDAMDYFGQLLQNDPILKDIIEKTREEELDFFDAGYIEEAELVEETKEKVLVDEPLDTGYDGEPETDWDPPPDL